MKRCLKMLLLSAFSLVTLASAAVGETGPSRDWEKIRLEERISEKVTRALGTLLSPTEYLTTVKVDLTAPPSRRLNASRPGAETFSLGKLDLDPAFADSVEQRAFLAEISRVSLSVYVDPSVPEPRFQMVKKLATEVVGSLGILAPAVKTERAPLIRAAGEAPKLTSAELMREFKTPAAVVISTLILCGSLFLALLLAFVSYSRIESRRLSLLETKEAREESLFQAQQQKQAAESSPRFSPGGKFRDAEAAVAAPGVAVATVSAVPRLEGVEPGVDRLRKLLAQAPEDVGSMVKQWLKAPHGKRTREALKTLSLLLSLEDLGSIFDQLNEDDKKLWRKILADSIDDQGIARGNAFITTQVIESLLNRKQKAEVTEAVDVLDEIRTAEAVDIAEADARLAGILVNMLPTQQVSELFSKLSPDLANQVALESLRFSESDLPKGLEKIKKLVREIRKGKAVSRVPFVDKALDVLADMTPDHEGALFMAIAESGDRELLGRAARTLFPAELIFDLPPPILKSALERLPMNKRVDLLQSMGEDDRRVLLEVFGPEGGKARTLMEEELQEVQRDPMRVKRVERLRGELWSAFVAVVRTMIGTDETAAEAAEQMLLNWMESKQPGGDRAA